MKTISRKFSVPVLDEPFNNYFTQEIYDAEKIDYENKNGGKPFNCFIVSGMEFATESGYIRSMDEAEKEVEKRIKTELEEQIKHYSGRLKRLLQAQKKFNNGGIKTFEII